MTKRMLADVLWEAANVWLWDGKPKPTPDYRTQFSCWAAGDAHNRGEDDMNEFFKSCGCEPSRGDGFSHFRHGPIRQGVRYMWLLLAMHVAQDERIAL